MAQYFYIKQDSELPTLRMELINDGRYNFNHTFNNVIQNADVTFSMKDENDILKISNASCSIIESTDSGCEERYFIEYKWKKKDTNKKGIYKGEFTITIKDDIYENDVYYPSGTLKMPIYEDLYIQVK